MTDTYDGQGRLLGTKGERAGDTSLGSAAAVQDRMKPGGLGSLAAKGQSGFQAPKQEPGEDAVAYSKRVADAREAYRQKQAMTR